MRTRNVPTPGHSVSSSARCAEYAAATAASASSNTAITASPPYFTMRPPAAVTASRRSASWVGEHVRHRLGVRFPQRRMALDVGEEKGRGRARRCSDGPRTAHARRLPPDELDRARVTVGRRASGLTLPDDHPAKAIALATGIASVITVRRNRRGTMSPCFSDARGDSGKVVQISRDRGAHPAAHTFTSVPVPPPTSPSSSCGT